jgi:hypothetical protein
MNEIDRYIMDTLGSIRQLVEANYYTQALIIIYSAIDTMSWANLTTGDVTRRDIVDWVNLYIDPENTLGCSANDLYAARCVLVHSTSTESRMSRVGDAREIWYVTSPHSRQALQEYAQENNSQALVVELTHLVALFVDAADRFNIDIYSDQERLTTVNQRIASWIRFTPSGSIAGA